jgi:hypothetical protein
MVQNNFEIDSLFIRTSLTCLSIIYIRHLNLCASSPWLSASPFVYSPLLIWFLICDVIVEYVFFLQHFTYFFSFPILHFSFYVHWLGFTSGLSPFIFLLSFFPWKHMKFWFTLFCGCNVLCKPKFSWVLFTTSFFLLCTYFDIPIPLFIICFPWYFFKSYTQLELLIVNLTVQYLL